MPRLNSTKEVIPEVKNARLLSSRRLIKLLHPIQAAMPVNTEADVPSSPLVINKRAIPDPKTLTNPEMVPVQVMEIATTP